MPHTTIIVTDHTASDYRWLLENGLDPADVQPREHAVPCQSCRRGTFNLAAVCARCEAPR